MPTTTTTPAGVTVVKYSVRETAAAVRKALKARWPGVKFSVTMSRGTGYGWLSVTYTDGPLHSAVDRLTAQYQDSYWSGQDEQYHPLQPTPAVAPDGTLEEHHYSSCGINATRHYSPEAQAWADSVATRGSWWWPDGVEPYRDNQYAASSDLLAGTDLTDGFPENPRAAYVERWQR